MKNINLFIITGCSGSGKSTAMAAFEDAGFYCVDNLPVDLLPKFLELPIEYDSQFTGLAFVMDLREKGLVTKFPAVFEALRRDGYRFEILFLEADESTLLRRYSQTRRQHPLSQSLRLIESIRTEKAQLKELRVAANKIIDTSQYNVHELKAAITTIAQRNKSPTHLKINIQSFGFKYGLPQNPDLVVDVRFLPNPYFISELKNLDGQSGPVCTYVLENDACQGFLKIYLDLLDYLIPLYEKEGKAYLTIGVGCTGGRHRSVAIAGCVYKHLQQQKRRVAISHRDILLG